MTDSNRQLGTMGERRIINQTLSQNTRFTNNRSAQNFDQVFDQQTQHHNGSLSNANSQSNKDLGGILNRDRSIDRLTTAKKQK